MNKKRKRNMQSNYFLRTGVKLFRKAIGRSLDISALVKSNFSKKSLTKHNYGIYSDQLHFSETDEVTNEVTSMLFSMPGDSSYPEISPENNKRWLAILDIKPQKSRFGYMGELLLYYRYLFRAIKSLIRITKESVCQARQGGTFKGTPTHDMANYLFSRSIANRYRHDTGRHRNPEKRGEDDTSQAKYVSREVKLDITRFATPASETFIDQVDMEMLLQKVMEVITDPRDKATLELYYACFDNKTTIEKEHKRKLRKYQGLGLRTPASVRQRWHRIPQKYSEKLKKLNPLR